MDIGFLWRSLRFPQVRYNNRGVLLLLLLLRHSAKSLNEQEERLATSPHAIVVRLHERKINVAILTPEVVVTVGV